MTTSPLTPHTLDREEPESVPDGLFRGAYLVGHLWGRNGLPCHMSDVLLDMMRKAPGAPTDDDAIMAAYAIGHRDGRDKMEGRRGNMAFSRSEFPVGEDHLPFTLGVMYARVGREPEMTETMMDMILMFSPRGTTPERVRAGYGHGHSAGRNLVELDKLFAVPRLGAT